MNKMFLCCKRL